MRRSLVNIPSGMGVRAMIMDVWYYLEMVDFIMDDWPSPAWLVLSMMVAIVLGGWCSLGWLVSSWMHGILMEGLILNAWNSYGWS